MVVVTGWEIDAVIARLLDSGDRETLREAAEALPDGLIKDRVPLDGINARGIAISVDRRNGVRRIAGACTLGASVRYASGHDRSYHVMGPNGPEGLRRVEFEPSLSVRGTVPPQTVVDALVGRHACDVFDHRALRVDGLVAKASYVDTNDGVPCGFSIGLPQLRAAL